jgi:hypothetical protein
MVLGAGGISLVVLYLVAAPKIRIRSRTGGLVVAADLASAAGKGGCAGVLPTGPWRRALRSRRSVFTTKVFAGRTSPGGRLQLRAAAWPASR